MKCNCHSRGGFSTNIFQNIFQQNILSFKKLSLQNQAISHSSGKKKCREKIRYVEKPSFDIFLKNYGFSVQNTEQILCSNNCKQKSHRIICRLERTSGGPQCNCLLKASSLRRSDHVAWGFLQTGLEKLQGCRLHSLSGQPAPL